MVDIFFDPASPNLSMPPSPAFGEREPREAGPESGRFEGSLRARWDFTVFAVLNGLSIPVIWGLGLIDQAKKGYGTDDAWGFILVGLPYFICSAVVLSVALWMLFVPLVRLYPNRMVTRFVPWKKSVEVIPAEVIWHPKTRFVGRFLLLHGLPKRRLPIWLLRRPHQRRLFDWLDAWVAGRSAPVVDPVPQAREEISRYAPRGQPAHGERRESSR